MRKSLLLTWALALCGICAKAATVNFAWPLYAGQEGAGTIYYKLDTDTKEATVISGDWQYTGTVIIPDEVEYLGEQYEVTTIGYHAFYSSYDLEEVVFGANVHTIKNQAFYRCGTNIKMNLDSDGLRVIESSGIAETSITGNRGDTLLLGKNLVQLGPTSITDYSNNWYTWGSRYNIKFIKVAEGNTHFCNDAEGVLYNSDKTALIAYPSARVLPTYEIPATVTTVRQYAFNGAKVTKVTGGDNVVRIGGVVSGNITSFRVGPKVNTMGTTAFMYCGGSFIPDVDPANTTFAVIDKSLYKYTATDTILCRLYRGSTMVTYVVPANVTQIGGYAFYSHGYLKYIDFQNCTKLKSSKIDGSAFHSTNYSVEFLNSENIFANVDGVLYTDDLKRLVLYGTNVTLEDYVMPTATTTIPVSTIKPNSYVKTFAINKACNSLNTEYLYNMVNLESYSIDATNGTYSVDESGVLYNKAQTQLLSYPRGNTRAYYKVADGTTQINVKAFYQNQYLKVLDLGSNIKSVMNGNNLTLASMTSLRGIRVSTMVPPTVSTSSFSMGMLTNGTIKLYVPLEDGAEQIYKNASVWKRFSIVKDTSLFDADMRNIDVDYSVKHYWQNIDNDEYILAETNNVTGKMLSTTAVEAKTADEYAGFTAQPFSQIKLDNSNMSVNIYYNRKPFSVTWKNGSTQISTKSYRYGAPFLQDKPADPTPVGGKHFVGWNTNADATIALTFSGSERVPASNTTYYAIFADNATKPYTVEHYQQNADNDGYTKVDADTEEDSKPFGAQTTAVAKSYSGFTAQPFSQQAVAEDGSTVIKIYYNRNLYTVTWMNGSTQVLSDSYKYGSALQVPANPAAPVATKHFVGWNTNASATTAMPVATQTVPIDGATYYAIFADNDSKQYTVEHYQQNLDGQTYTIVGDDTESGSGLVGATTQATANTYAGFTAQPISQGTIAESGTVVKIYYNRNKYDVVWKNGTATLSTNANVMFGAAVQAPANPAAEAGYHFVGWNTDSQATSAINMAGQTVAVGGNTYYAIFAQNATVHYTVKHYQENLDGTYPAEPTNTDEGTGVFGLQTAATARSYTGFTAQTISQQTILEDESTVVRIEYKRNTHSLSWNANGGTLSGGTSGNAVKYGAPITAPTYSRTGYEFKGWGLTADAAETVAPATTMPDADLTYYAIWKINDYIALWYYNNETQGFKVAFTGSPHTYGTAITVPFGKPNAEDYDGHHDFVGWSKTATGVVIPDDGDFGIMTEKGAEFYAIWKAHSNTLTWDANGGSALTGNYTSGTVDYGTAITAPNNPTRTGYTFMGWATTLNGAPTDVFETMPDEELNYYAVWQINQRTITWNANGGGALTGDYTKGSVDYNTIIIKPADPTRTGYDFVGWNTSQEATTAITTATTMPDNDLTYYAVWNAHKHNLTWHPNGGEFTNIDPSDSVTSVAYGTAIEPPLVNRADWKMAGWGLTAGATPSDVVTPAPSMPDNDLTYYAIWILKTNYVTWKQNYNADDDLNYTSTSVEVGDPITAPSGAPTREHYQFIGWSATRDGAIIENGDFGVMDESKKEFYAQWNINSNILTWDANGGEIIAAGTNGYVTYGYAITQPVAVRTGYTFKGWGTTSAAIENEAVEITTMPDADVTYYAIWAANPYDVAWMRNDGTSESFAVTTATFDGEITAPATNPTRDFYSFAGWAATPESEVLDNLGTLTTEGATFYAKWNLKKFTLGWDANGGELSGNYTPAGDVEYGTPIVVPTVTRTNYVHAGWGTSVKPDSLVNITTMPDSAVTYVAIWTNDNIEWRKNYEPDGNYAATTANLGEQIVPPVDPERPNYQFLGWSDAADGDVITDFGTMDSGHKIFYAQWQIHSNTLTWNANGGELSGNYTQGNVEFGTEIVRPVAVREGYTFNGWNTFAEAVDSISISTMPDNDVEYFAVWKVNKYTIAWLMNNGTDSVFATTNVNYADTIKAPQTQPERTDYNFKGWAATTDGTVIDSLGLVPDSNVVFYAVWSKIVRYAAVWYINDSTIFKTDSLAIGENIVAPASNPKLDGFTFLGWSDAEGNLISTFGEMPAADTAFYAAWEEIIEEHKLTIDWYINDGTNAIFKTDTLAQGMAIVAPAENPVRTGFSFKGWTDAASNIVENFGTAISDTAFYATWEEIDDSTLVAVNWLWNNGIDSTYLLQKYNQGDDIIAPLNPERKGFTFQGWSAEETGVSITNFGQATTDTAFYAIWVKNQYLITWNSDQNHVFKTDTIAYGDSIKAPTENPERTHYIFKGWAANEADSVIITNFGTVVSDITFYAVWEEEVVEQYTAIWYYNDGTTSAFEATKVNVGAPILAPTSTPNRDNYEFKGWATTTDGVVTTDFGTMSASGAAFYAVWEAIVAFDAPRQFNSCESGEDFIELTNIVHNNTIFEWKVNGIIDTVQTGNSFEFSKEMPLKGTIEVTGILGNSRLTKTIEYQRNKEMLRTMWDDVITVINSEGHFKSYKWYQNDILVGTDELYYEAGGLTGTYYLVATTTDGDEITSCEMSFAEPDATIAITAYPNPVINTVLVKGSELKVGGQISIIDNDGKVRLVKDIETDGEENLNLSNLPQGIYIVKVGTQTVSVIKL